MVDFVSDLINGNVPGSPYQFPVDLYSVSPGIVKFQPINEFGGDVGSEVTLPLPQQLTFADAATYENADLGFLGAAYADGKISEASMNTLEKAMEEEGGLKELTRGLVTKVTGNRTRLRVGATPNPNTRALFKQPNLRTHQFSFKMIPTQPQEVDIIKNIIEAMRSELYPTSTGGSAGLSALTGDAELEIAYNLPNRFEISMWVGAEQNKYLIEPKIMPCFLTAVQTSYNSSSNAVLSDGSTMYFSEVDLSLTFLEERAIYKSGTSPSVLGDGF